MTVSNFLRCFFRLGSVSAFILGDDTGDWLWQLDPDWLRELWQLKPETPVPKELLFTREHGSRRVEIRPLFKNTTTPEKFRKVCLTGELNCMNVDALFL